MCVCARSQLEIGSVSSSRSAQIERSARVTRIQRCGSPAILHFYLPRDLVTRSTRSYTGEISVAVERCVAPPRELHTYLHGFPPWWKTNSGPIDHDPMDLSSNGSR